MAGLDKTDGIDVMRAALAAYRPLPFMTRRPPTFSRYMTKKLKVVLPDEDLQLWLRLSVARGWHVFYDAFHGDEPATQAERNEIETILHELCAATGYKATIYKGAVSGLYLWQISRHKYASMAKRRAKLLRELAANPAVIATF